MGARKTRRLIVGMLLTVMAVIGAMGPAAAADGTREATNHTRPLERLVTPTPMLDPVPNGTVGIPSSVGYVDDSGPVPAAWVVGEVWNRTSAKREFIRVTATFFNGTTELGSAEGYAYLERLVPGMRSPFLVEFHHASISVGTTAYSLAVDPGMGITVQPVGGLRAVQGTTTVSGGEITYTGTIHNPNDFAVDLVDANITLYNSAGEVIDVWWSYTTPDTIPARGSGTYEVVFFEPLEGAASIHRVSVVSQGWRTGTESYVTSWSNYFDDIANTAFRNDIIWLAESGITAGCAAGKYCPTAQVKRDQMASFLSRAMELTGTAPNAFGDDNGNIHELNINRLAAAGVTSGCAAGKFCPADPVARDQMASFLSRAMELTGTAPNAFSDDNGNIHELNINRLAAAGVTSGCGGTNYCPKVDVTRDQMAAFLKRAFD
jgi:hypothetical protein